MNVLVLLDLASDSGVVLRVVVVDVLVRLLDGSLLLP